MAVRRAIGIVGLAAALVVPGVIASADAPGTVTISYTFTRLLRIASNQVAVWIEDAEGTYVRTLSATDFMARRGGWTFRPECCPEWVKASGLAGWSEGQVDAASSATPRSGRVSVTWDCTDDTGAPVRPGIYRYLVEGNLFWDERVLWTGSVAIGGGAAGSTATPAWIPAGAERSAPLISEVTAAYEPAR